jgi:hypothetical protein
MQFAFDEIAVPRKGGGGGGSFIDGYNWIIDGDPH